MLPEPQSSWDDLFATASATDLTPPFGLPIAGTGLRPGRCGAMDFSALVPSVGHLAFLPHIRDLTIAYVLAFLIGWNRERKGHSAGIRTFPLVAIAACGFIQATEGMLRDNPDSMARIIAGVITGVGFIGGGAILKGGGEVHGTATAASLWTTGAIGVSVGLANYDVAVVICFFTFVTLYALDRLKPADPDEPGMKR